MLSMSPLAAMSWPFLSTMKTTLAFASLNQTIHDRLDLIELLLVHHHLRVDHRSSVQLSLGASAPSGSLRRLRELLRRIRFGVFDAQW